MNVALVVQRYGAEVHGGAETLARRMAELLVDHVELEVPTTCAVDYLSGPTTIRSAPTKSTACRSDASVSPSHAISTPSRRHRERPTSFQTISFLATTGCAHKAQFA